MYGTIARMRVKKGMEQRFLELSKEEEGLDIPGFMRIDVFRLDRDANEYMMSVVFRDKESYFANADSPEQDARYRQMRELLESDPEWFDGEVVYAWQAGRERSMGAA